MNLFLFSYALSLLDAIENISKLNFIDDTLDSNTLDFNSKFENFKIPQRSIYFVCNSNFEIDNISMFNSILSNFGKCSIFHFENFNISFTINSSLFTNMHSLETIYLNNSKIIIIENGAFN